MLTAPGLAAGAREHTSGIRRLLAVLILTAAVGAGGGSAASPKTVLAIDSERVGTGAQAPWRSRLLRVDALTLRPVRGPSVVLGHPGRPWTLSPNGRLLAGATDSGIRIADVKALRRVGDVRTGARPLALAWIAPRTLVGFDARGVFTADPLTRRTIAREAVAGELHATAQTTNALVLLLAPKSGTDAARVVVVGTDARPRIVALERIRLTSMTVGADVATVYSAGLAVDGAGERAFVVAADAPVAEIALGSAAPTYHELQVPVLRRPAVRAKVRTGPWRRARWLGNGLIAVSGWDYGTCFLTCEQLGAHAPAGLKLIDTRDWSVRMVDPGASTFAVAGGVLLAHGTHWVSGSNEVAGMGMTAYDLQGRELFHLFGDERVDDARTVAPYMYVTVGDVTKVVDLDRRAVVETIEIPLPFALPQLVAAQR